MGGFSKIKKNNIAPETCKIEETKEAPDGKFKFSQENEGYDG